MGKPFNKSEESMFETSSTSETEADKIIHLTFEKYNNRLHGFLRSRLQSKEDADDVAQEVFLRLVRYNELDKLQISLTLLCKIASNIIVDRVRKEKVRSADEHFSLDDPGSYKHKIASSYGSPDQIIQSKEGANVFMSAFKELNINSRRAFLLNRVKGLTYEDIAERMDISRSMVQKHISKVIMLFRDKFEDYL